jgi:hypothetical protein
MEFSYACAVASLVYEPRTKGKNEKETDRRRFFSYDMKTFYADAFIMKLYMNNSLCLHDDDDDVCVGLIKNGYMSSHLT